MNCHKILETSYLIQKWDIRTAHWIRKFLIVMPDCCRCLCQPLHQKVTKLITGSPDRARCYGIIFTSGTYKAQQQVAVASRRRFLRLMCVWMGLKRAGGVLMWFRELLFVPCCRAIFPLCHEKTAFCMLRTELAGVIAVHYRPCLLERYTESTGVNRASIHFKPNGANR